MQDVYVPLSHLTEMFASLDKQSNVNNNINNNKKELTDNDTIPILLSSRLCIKNKQIMHN